MKWNLMRLQQPVFLLKDTHCIAEDTVRRSYSVFIPKLKVQVSAQFTQTEILELDWANQESYPSCPTSLSILTHTTVTKVWRNEENAKFYIYIISECS